MKCKKSSNIALILLCGLFAVANCSPAGKKDSLKTSSKDELEKKIDPTISEKKSAESNDETDLLARAKKSSTVTTFCVEIKPGNDQPTVVVCDPSKTDEQLPIPTSTLHPNPPAPHQVQPIPSIIPDYIPQEYPRDYPPQPSLPYEPLIFIPQQPQILQPQILSPYYQPPQIILVRDPSCPSNNPSIISNPLQTSNLYSRPAGRSSPYETGSSNIWTSGNEPAEESQQRSIPGYSLGGLNSNAGYTSGMNLFYPGRGAPQQNPAANSVTVNHGPAIVNGNQNPNTHLEHQYDRPVLVQCNPSVIPLSQDAYAAALANAKSNQQMFKDSMGHMGHMGHSQQFMNQPAGGQGYHGTYPTHGSVHHQKGMSMHNVHQYQSNTYPQNQPYNMHQGMMRAAEETQNSGAVKNGQEMSMQQAQTVPNSFAKNVGGNNLAGQSQQSSSQSSFIDQTNRQGVSGGESRALNGQENQQQKIGIGAKAMEGSQNFQSSFNDQVNHQGISGGNFRALNGQENQQQKMGTGGKVMEGSQIFDNHQYSNSFGQGKSSFMTSGDHAQMSKSNDHQGFQKPLGYSQEQQQQQMSPKAPCNSDLEQNPSQRNSGKDTSYSQMLLQRMKSAVAQNNLVQPFMMPSPGSQSEKQAQPKM